MHLKQLAYISVKAKSSFIRTSQIDILVLLGPFSGASQITWATAPNGSKRS